ncbi:diacylglycerol kinase family enzyme [Inquilinus ginsengisoli]|uniref:Diacylglycerol kinase family enzyme n=1 Tax=Inquilinus ginsengisoli TaxID=363840 RepID=A0ABU1JPK4_9PROT|nr:diacylglycerol kinase family protein [Inquilinus ginsengisoli]MDR6290551.1 diacylglycerol kinase family enzyme [Inquilinus ginsengisoli]
MRVALVLNGASGALLGQAPATIVDRFERLLAAGGAEARVAVAEGPALDLAIDAALASDAQAILIGGGDGTLIAAAERLLPENRIGPARPLGILPLGTANLLARDLGIPLTPEAAVPALLSGTTRRIDVAVVNGRIFLNSSLLGVAPLMVQQRERMRRRRGPLKWLLLARAFFRALDRTPRLHVVLQAEGRPMRLVTRTLAVSNNPLAEGFAAIHSRTALDGGQLGVYAARLERRVDLWRILARVVAGTWQHDPATAALIARRVNVVARRRHLWVANDGENHLLAMPLRYRILPRALTVLVPRSGTDRPES